MIKIKELRHEKGLTQSELATLLGVNQTAVGKYERGELEPNIHTLKKLADIFECSIDYLAGREDDFGAITIKGAQGIEYPANVKELLKIFNSLPKEYQVQVLEYARYFDTRINNAKKN